MKRKFFVVGVIGIASMLLSCGKEKNPFEKKSGPVTQEPTTSEKPEKKVYSGGELYVSKCSACHGNDGSLGVGGAKNIAESTLTQEEREELISNGKKTMPAFKDQLSSEEIKAIAEYTFTLK